MDEHRCGFTQVEHRLFTQDWDQSSALESDIDPHWAILRDIFGDVLDVLGQYLGQLGVLDHHDRQRDE